TRDPSFGVAGAAVRRAQPGENHGGRLRGRHRPARAGQSGGLCPGTSALGVGSGGHALDKAVAYVRDRAVWGVPIGAHQGLAHPLAQCKIELELARLMTQKAAFLYDTGQDSAAGEAANMAKYAAAEASVRAADRKSVVE